MGINYDNQENKDVYNKLTETKEASDESNKKWTLYLILCCLTVTSASFQFGYNIASLNSPTEVLKEFIFNETILFNEYHNKSQLFIINEGYIKGNETKLENAKVEYLQRKEEYFSSLFSLDIEYKKRIEERKVAKEKEIREKYNMTIDEYFEFLTNRLKEKKELLESYRPKLAEGKSKVEKVTNIIWTVINCLFVIGGMIGAFTSKSVLDILGRKKGILFNNCFTIIASVLVFVSFYVKSPICLLISRFLYGVQGGMSCSLIPTYLNEISPSALRGQTGVMHQLCLTVGILVAQILGLNQLLGSRHLWNFLLAMPLIPAVIGCIALILFFPETPKALLIKNGDNEAAEKALQLLRNRVNVNAELQEIKNESNTNQSNSNAITLVQLFTKKELRWPLLTSLVLQMAQQFCGINAIFFYSTGIFKNASIQEEHIQYAVVLTGVVNVICTIVCVPLIDRLGRKPLLVFPMVAIILDFSLLTICLIYQKNGMIFSYLSIICIIIFIMCFAVGLGPIPFIYVAEVFRQDARGAALAICMLTNWIANLILTLTFPTLADLLSNYVFVVFTIIVGISLLVIILKVPETKGKSVEENIATLNGKKCYQRTENVLLSTKA